MKKYGAVLWVVSILALGYGRSTAAPVPPLIKDVVAFIYIQNEKGELVPNGTGFFVGVQDTKNSDVWHGYLVTARHVISEKPFGPLLRRIVVRLNKISTGVSEVNLPIVTQGRNKNTFIHAENTVDLAVIRFAPDEKIFRFKFLPSTMITTKTSFESLGISEGTDVFFTGLLTHHVGESQNLPIVRFGRVALITDEKINWDGQKMDLYLIESWSYGGNSGSPVFFYLGVDSKPGALLFGPGKVYLAGIVMGSFNRGDQIKFVPGGAAPVPISVANIGISAIVPAYKLLELLSSDELKQLHGEASGH